MKNYLIIGLSLGCFKKDNLKDLFKIKDKTKVIHTTPIKLSGTTSPIEKLTDSELFELKRTFDKNPELLTRIKNGERCVRCDLTTNDPNMRNFQ